MSKWLTTTLCILLLNLPSVAMADPKLIKMAQEDLVALGYDPGNTQGEMTTETIIAVSKFQAEHDLEVTGEVTPQLIGVLRAAKSKPGEPTVADTAAAPAASPQVAPQQPQLSLEQRRQACLQEKYAAAQERQKKKRGMMRLLSAVTRTSNQFGGGDTARTISQVSNDVYSATATADDLEQAGKDLGLTPDEIEACRNPPQ